MRDPCHKKIPKWNIIQVINISEAWKEICQNKPLTEYPNCLFSIIQLESGLSDCLMTDSWRSSMNCYYWRVSNQQVDQLNLPSQLTSMSCFQDFPRHAVSFHSIGFHMHSCNWIKGLKHRQFPVTSHDRIHQMISCLQTVEIDTWAQVLREKPFEIVVGNIPTIQFIMFYFYD